MSSKRRVYVLVFILLLAIGGLAAVHLLHLQVPYLEDIEASKAPGEGVAWRDQVQIEGPFARTVDFVAYAPKPRPGERLAVLVYVGGYNIRPTWITAGPWAAFADQARFALIGPFFFVDLAEFARDESYHQPQMWSGEALDLMIARLGERAAIDPQQIHLFGFSAGAQFAHRYALTHPTQVRAVVAHAPGAVTPPGLFTPTRFLFTVGALDETRLEEPRPFLAAAQSFKIDASLKVFPGLDHRLSLPVLEAARAFFVSTKL